MKILVVSGFLGAGKTTFIKELLQRTGIQAAVLENEYGETDLDSRAVSSAGSTDVFDFMEGCVCCTQKDAFANSIITISAGLDPDYLIVEPSGIGKLGSILENIRRVSYEKIRLLKPVLLLSPRSMAANFQAYPEIFSDQLRNAEIILLSKCEHEDSGTLEQATEFIRRYNRTASVLTRPYRLQEPEWWGSLLAEEGEEPERRKHGGRQSFPALPREEGAHGHVHSDREDHGHEQDTEAPVQLAFHAGEVSHAGELVVLLEDLLHGAFGSIVRAKGALRAGGEWVRFDVADGLYAIIGETEDTEPKTQLVFIGRDMREDLLRDRLYIK